MKLTLMILIGALLCAVTAGDPIAEVWKRIELARKAKIKSPNKLNPPASEQDIDELEKHLGCEIPQQLRASLRLHDGMDASGLEIVAGDDTVWLYRWLGVAEIREQWDEDRQRQKEAEAEGDKFQVDPNWIPIFVDPVESEEIVYLDSSSGKVLLRRTPASRQIQPHRYPDLKSFLDVQEHFISNGWQYEWGRDANWKPGKSKLKLDEDGIALLIKSQKAKVTLNLADGTSTEIKEKGNEFANKVLESFKPVRFVRTPGVQNPDQELSFSVNGKDVLIAIKRADGVKLPSAAGKLNYSIGNKQFTGGDAAKLQKLISNLYK